MMSHPRAAEGRLILVRHAQTRPDPAVESAEWRLDETARDDCRRLAVKLAPLNPGRVVTSDHHKAIATGSHLAEFLDLPREQASGLEEHDRTSVPFVEDPREFQGMVGQVFERPDEVVLGTESANEALERFEAAVRREVSRRPDDRLILVSHATVMALFVARYNDLDGFEFWKTLEMPEGLVLSLPEFGLLERVAVGGASNEEFKRRQ